VGQKIMDPSKRSRRVIRKDQDQERKVRVDYFSLSSHAVSPESLSSQFVL
jgi:hypothetical protein